MDLEDPQHYREHTLKTAVLDDRNENLQII